MALSKSIVVATEYFAKNVLMTELSVTDSRVGDGVYCSSIDVIGSENYTFFIYICNKSLTKMSSLFLYVDEPDETTKRDLVCEIANVIVGRAKVEASEKFDYKFDISTPKFIGTDEKVPSHELELNFLFEGETFTVIGKKN
ncbi:MAG: chemotaxis protein CheX [Campylobacterales bacterium]|nr:chemotaxis protein CheX [Campylobacterales bacterium]